MLDHVPEHLIEPSVSLIDDLSASFLAAERGVVPANAIAADCCAYWQWAPTLESLDSPILSAILESWRKAKVDQESPFDSSVIIEESHPAYSYINILEVLNNGYDFRFRIYGAGVAQSAGRDWTGSTVSTMMRFVKSGLGLFYLSVYRAVFIARQPLLTEHTSPKWLPVKNWRRLILPLRNKNDIVSGFIVGNIPIGTRPLLDCELVEQHERLGKTARDLLAEKLIVDRALALQANKLSDSQMAIELFQSLNIPAALLTRDCHLLSMNSLFRKNSEYFHKSHFNTLRPLHLKSAHLLDEAINELLSNPNAPVVFPLFGPLGSKPYVASMRCVKIGIGDNLDGARFVLLLTCFSNAAPPPASLLCTLFGLTPAEAELARRIAGGDSLDQIAKETERSQNTIRTQLKIIFQKTGTGRQHQLAALLMGRNLQT